MLVLTKKEPMASLQKLKFKQVERLVTVMTTPVNIFPNQGNFPSLRVSPSKLVKLVQNRLEHKGVSVNDVRLNGSGASFCLAEECEHRPQLGYKDLDVIFGVELRDDFDLHIIKDQVLKSLLELFPEGARVDRISTFMLEKAYVKKMVKISTGTDQWSLISFGDDSGMNIELKFVHQMRRQYEFSVDSFQIIVDPIMFFDDARDGEKQVRISPSFFPCVYATSMYGSYSDALAHLNKRLIFTKNPEQIRGGGLLKYCYLKASGYQLADAEVMESLEPYMCCRFFIDFPLANSQYLKINKYLYTRFLQRRNVLQGIEFLDALLRVVSHCCLENERRKMMGIVLQLRASLSRTVPPATYFQPSMFYQVPPLPITVHKQWLYQNHYAPHCHFHQYKNPSWTYNRRHRRYNWSSNKVYCHGYTPPRFFFPHTVNNTVPICPVQAPV